ncbi:MAG: PAS domain-containing protein [Bacteroidetes bacterium]|nr:PAS domain-containing protein [Bacteroidota bacterium]MBU1422153.1 PAS domain-containing protein [Bacteroidota bacterium]MBU2636474.1 PAS domain-containing protein [Bacteroidota bacterium]
MQKKNSKSKYYKIIQPRYIIAITIVLAIIMVVSAFFELSQSRDELYHLMTEEATSLIETITLSSKNTVLSNAEVENQIAERLLTIARTVAYIDSFKTLNISDLKRIAEENKVYRINIFDAKGNKILSSNIPEPEHQRIREKHSPVDFIAPILKDEKDEIVIGLKEARYENGTRYAVAVRRASNKRGAVVVNIDAEYLLEFRKRIGFGKMIQDLGDKSSTEYILLQDEEGIIAASKSVDEMNPIEDDEFLMEAYKTGSISTRVTSFKDKDVYEVVKNFIINGENFGLLRLGLAMDEVNAMEERMFRRAIIISLVLLVISVIVISIIVVNQNLQMVSREYQKVQTYTGSILQNMADAVITTDSEGKITIFNRSAEELCSVSIDQAVGKNISQFMDGQLKVIIESLLSRNPLKDFEFQVTCNNRKKMLSVDTSFVYDRDGKLDSFTAVLRDITELRAMEKQMQQREKLVAMGELASGVAHEIRNPLNSIHMIGQRYEKEFIPESNKEEYFSITKVLKNEVQRVNNIVQQFLRFARPPKLNIIQYSSKAFLNEIETLIRPQTDSKDVEFKIIAEDDVTLPIDKDQMMQAFLNLLRNSIEATPKGGRVSLSFRRENLKVIFVVEDTGAGIPPENINKIFNLYFSTKSTGTGIGLSIVQQIIAQHNGVVFVESALGKGTKFTIEIPLKKETMYA